MSRYQHQNLPTWDSNGKHEVSHEAYTEYTWVVLDHWSTSKSMVLMSARMTPLMTQKHVEQVLLVGDGFDGEAETFELPKQARIIENCNI